MKKVIYPSFCLLLVLMFSACSGKEKNADYADGTTGATMKSQSNKRASSVSDMWPNQLNLSLII